MTVLKPRRAGHGRTIMNNLTACWILSAARAWRLQYPVSHHQTHRQIVLQACLYHYSLVAQKIARTRAVMMRMHMRGWESVVTTTSHFRSKRQPAQLHRALLVIKRDKATGWYRIAAVSYRTQLKISLPLGTNLGCFLDNSAIWFQVEWIFLKVNFLSTGRLALRLSPYSYVFEMWIRRKRIFGMLLKHQTLTQVISRALCTIACVSQKNWGGWDTRAVRPHSRGKG